MSKRRHCDDHDDNVDGEVIPSDPEERLSEAVLSRHILRKDDSSRNRKSKKFGETDAKRTSGKGDVSSDSSSSSSSDSDMSSSNCASSRSGSPVATKKREKGSKNKSSAAAAERRRFPKSIEDQEEENKTSSTSVGERKDGQCKNRNSSGQEDCKARSEHSKPKEKESYIDAKKLEGLEHHHDSSSESVGETQKLDSKKGKKKKHSKRKRSKSGMKKKRRSRSCTASGSEDGGESHYRKKSKKMKKKKKKSSKNSEKHKKKHKESEESETSNHFSPRHVKGENDEKRNKAQEPTKEIERSLVKTTQPSRSPSSDNGLDQVNYDESLGKPKVLRKARGSFASESSGDENEAKCKTAKGESSPEKRSKSPEKRKRTSPRPRSPVEDRYRSGESKSNEKIRKDKSRSPLQRRKEIIRDRSRERSRSPRDRRRRNSAVRRFSDRRDRFRRDTYLGGDKDTRRRDDSRRWEDPRDRRRREDSRDRRRRDDSRDRRRRDDSRDRRRRDDSRDHRSRRNDSRDRDGAESPKMWPKKVKKEISSSEDSDGDNMSSSPENKRKGTSSAAKKASPEPKRARRDSSPTPKRNVGYREESRNERRRSKSRSNSPRKRDKRFSRGEYDAHNRDSQPDRKSRGSGGDRSRQIKHELDDDGTSAEQDSFGKNYGLEKKTKHESDIDVAPSRESESKLKDRWSVSERWGSGKNDDPPVKEKEKVNLGVSGKLAEDTNMYRGVLIKYNEPPEAKKPTLRWRLYPFKGDEALPVLHIHRQSAYLIGRDRKIADLPIDHPSCSKQHAVLQYRSVPFERADGTKARRVLPYIIDLGSSNGTLLNGSKIEPQRYVELKEKDVLKFGFSSREFVVLNEKSAGDVNASDSEQGSPASD